MDSEGTESYSSIHGTSWHFIAETQTGIHTYIHTYGQSGVANEAQLKSAHCGGKPRVD